MKQTIMAVDIGSSKISCVIAEVSDGLLPKVIGVGFCKSQGIRKGAIVHIEQAARSIKTAVAEAKRMSGSDINRAIVSISGVYVKSRNSSGTITIPGGEIGYKEIYRVIQGALHHANIPAEYEVIHILPYQFMIDEQEFVDDPSGMSGDRLKAMVHIVTVQKTALDNLKRVVKSAGIEIENIVLSSYASSIAVLSDDEKELGVACIDAGGSTCDIVIHSGNSMCYDEVLKVGSHHITNDIAMVFNTPLSVAEEIKIGYGEIAQNNLEDHSSSKTLQIPTVGGSEKTHTITCGELSKVIYYRLAETFGFLYEMINQNELRSQIGAGVVFTGGLMKMRSIGDFVDAFFRDCPVRVALPHELEGMPDELKDQACSVVVGLILYGAGGFTNYEIDSEKRLKTKKSRLFDEEKIEIPNSESQKREMDIASVLSDDLPIRQEEKKEGMGDKLKKKLASWF